MRLATIARLAIGGFVLFSSAVALGQAKVPVLLEASTEDNDQVGRQFVFELKEAIRGSQAFRLVEDNTQWPRITVVMVTQSISDASTAVSFSFVYDSKAMPMRGAFLTAVVQTCGRNRVVGCARGILGDIDRSLDVLKSWSPELRKTLP